MPDEEILTIEELAAFLKLTPQTIYKWAQTGKVPGAKLGKEWRFRRSDIDRWLDERLAEGPAGKRARERTGASTPSREVRRVDDEPARDGTKTEKGRRETSEPPSARGSGSKTAPRKRQPRSKSEAVDPEGGAGKN